MFNRLNDNQVRYLVVGAYAVAIHGHPRYTSDLDLWIESTGENSERLIRALDQFGFGSLGLQADDFLVPHQVIQLGHPPARIDLLTTLSGDAIRTLKHQDGVSLMTRGSGDMVRQLLAVGVG